MEIRDIIQAAGYGFRYSGEDRAALSPMDFSIQQGEIILLAGDSGSGKSTFLKSLNGLIPEIVEGEMQGERVLNGRNMAETSIWDISRVVGSVFQNPRSQFFTLNSTSELVFPMENYGFSRDEMDGRLQAVSGQLAISPLMNRAILALSSGERQLLALACAMVLSPQLLLFDEPSANLDYANAMALRRLILALKDQGATVLVADHRFYYLQGVVDRVFLLEQGKLTIFDSEAAFRASAYQPRSFDLFHMDIPLPPLPVPGEAVAEVRHVSKWNVLKDVSFTLHAREIAVLVGVNGAGKTTLARMLTGNLPPDSGQIQTGEIPFCVMQDADYQLFGSSVTSEVRIGHPRLTEDTVQHVLESLDLWRYRDIHPFDLSGGEKQRLQIATAAVSDAQLIILDEPTSGLDIHSMERVVREIRKLAEQKGVLIISHDYEFIRKIAHRILYVHQGKVAQDFPLNEDTIPLLNQIYHQMEEDDE